MIHILKGTGENCTCGDCSVLYGGDCWTTQMNNLLDKFDEKVYELWVLAKNPSVYQIQKTLAPFKKEIMKMEKITSKEFDEYFYLFSGLFFMAWATNKTARQTQSYRQTRHTMFRIIIKRIESDRFAK